MNDLIKILLNKRALLDETHSVSLKKQKRCNLIVKMIFYNKLRAVAKIYERKKNVIKLN